MLEKYIPDEEYATYFAKLSGLRHRIAKDLPVGPGMSLLDLATGGGYFGAEIAKGHKGVRVTGVDIIQRDLREAREMAVAQGLDNRMSFARMDATQMGFPGSVFDMVVNFLGFEDVHMTRGRSGVEGTFLEVKRVLRPRGYFCLTVMPPEEMETDAQRIEAALFSYVCGATWLQLSEYEELLRKAGFRLTGRENYRTGKKLTSEQAEVEIRFACDNVPKTYGIETPPFTEVWERFGRDIEEHGLGHYSKLLSLTAQEATGAF